jgi:predicted RNase H-like nuclease
VPGQLQDSARAKLRSNQTLVGVDGCRGGWLAVSSDGDSPIVAQVHASFGQLVGRVGALAHFGVDIPMGLLERGARPCELEARQLLGRPRMSSVFPAPPRACLKAQTYEQACEICFRIEGKKMSRQAFGILPKIREVERYLRRHPQTRARVAEVHPEVSFATWSGGGVAHSKKTAAGKAERRALIEERWPHAVDQARNALRGRDYSLDDLYDAFAALWSAHRWLCGDGIFLGSLLKSERNGRRVGMLV